ncbi:MAG: hypothetical protein H7831_11020 [Magnetococcus sp. WYHC-3]
MRALLLALILAAGLPATAWAGFVGSPECNWLGNSLGLLGPAWEQTLAENRVFDAIKRHCLHRQCDRAPRRHFTLTYEKMPCNVQCIEDRMARFRQACGG